ncbi:hypothetical protein M9H77_09087 [Catharanthus roseus]|uniref:Uncharacterized protein n=1 Tax=Catharanthus roseus TaxID=4058 RepID=A0ACC0BZU0_CATRO|nr:hypothetical protein M9H77_09087 [Catharanthus roseus]
MQTDGENSSVDDADKLCSSENSSIQNASFVTEESDHSKGGQNSFSMSDEKIVIGIEDETKEFSDRLIGGCKQLEVIFVTGMADEQYNRILITSRVENVNLNIRPNSSPHVLDFLNREESWDLFQRKAFGNTNNFPEYLIHLGKGLPLAIVVIAGLLAKGEKTEIWWRHVANNIGSFINSNSKEFKNTLSLSYIHLPSHLKPCFLYLCSFPSDYEIPVKMLIKSCIAVGFISSKSGI